MDRLCCFSFVNAKCKETHLVPCRQIPKSLKRVGEKQSLSEMKKLTLEQMEAPVGGISTEAGIGLMCAATLALALSVVFAPIASATGTGCAVGLYAMHLWNR